MHEEIKQAFEDVVLPLIPVDWKYGDDLTIRLDCDWDGYHISTGPIGKNHDEYRSVEKVFKPLLLELSKWSREKLEISSGCCSVTYNRVTKALTEKCRWYVESLAYSLN